MGYSTKGGSRESDQILDRIDRARSRDDNAASPFDREATGRELNTEVPGLGAMQSERMRRLFNIVQEAYVACAKSPEIRKLAARFQNIGDLSDHRGNQLPDALDAARVIVRPRGTETAFIVGGESSSGFKIARDPDAVGPVTVDLMIIERGS